MSRRNSNKERRPLLAVGSDEHAASLTVTAESLAATSYGDRHVSINTDAVLDALGTGVDEHGATTSTTTTTTAPPATAASSSSSSAVRNASRNANHGRQQSVTLSALIQASTLANDNNQTQMQNIINAFNSHDGTRLRASHFITTSWIRGDRVKRGEFKVFHRNNIPFLVGPTEDQVASPITGPGISTGELGTYRQTKNYIGVNGVHIINVPPGQVALVEDGVKRTFLGQGPHVIHSPLIKSEPRFVNYTEPYIQHGTYHILRVPIGKIATVYFGNEPRLLMGQSEPYVFNDATFSLVKKSDNQLYFDATDRLIRHGSIKRINPHTGEVAITFKGGQLVIIEPANDGQPVTIDDPNHDVPDNAFLQCNTYTVTFPDERTDVKVVTKDGVDVNMQMTLTYTIDNPERAASQLVVSGQSPHDTILEHITKCAMTDMKSVTRNNNYYDAQSTDHTRGSTTTTTTAGASSAAAASGELTAPQFFKYVQDEIRDKLSAELRAKGIKLDRLDFSKFECSDPAVRNNMARNAQQTQDVYAQVALLEQQAVLGRETAIRDADVARIQKKAEADRAQLDADQQKVVTQGQAEREALAKQIAQKQANTNLVSQARAELEAAKLRAQAMVAEAEAKAKATTMQGEAIAGAKGALWLAQAKILAEHPQMLQVFMAQQQAQAMQGVSGFMVSPDVAKGLYAVGTPAFFTAQNDAGVQRELVVNAAANRAAASDAANSASSAQAAAPAASASAASE